MHESSDDLSLLEKLFDDSSPGCTSCAGDEVSQFFHVVDSVCFRLMKMMSDIFIDVMYHPHCQASKPTVRKDRRVGKIEQGSRTDEGDDRCDGRRPYSPYGHRRGQSGRYHGRGGAYA